ncbi:uncharacterized protein N7484_001866 [Penicillium longicatenatum]|uniref:uncharacterized protein n=1 Tax=Penicillium longicatenatum TaxID=1561947 RepID=UPI002548F041|nr:uncharacterized protein N7484_001866 [Penicillium longicatenatum]KAJ5658217.1 hypothetical protein N7484_001866 [Penicillium longicatenatum]
MILSPYLLSLLYFTTVRSAPLSPTENELRDLVTQESVVVRAGMATVIKDYRDGVTTIIDRRGLIDLVSELHGASEELLWSLYRFERSHLATGEAASKDAACRSAAQNIYDVMNTLSRTTGQIENWVLREI